MLYASVDQDLRILCRCCKVITLLIMTAKYLFSSMNLMCTENRYSDQI